MHYIDLVIINKYNIYEIANLFKHFKIDIDNVSDITSPV